jgi:5-methylcytosine-specific restriction endonuclease McrA
MLITCPVCQKQVERKGAAKYCSDECKRKSLNERLHPKQENVCAQCGKSFVASRIGTRFCSQKCRRLHQYWENPEYGKQKAKEWAKANEDKRKQTNNEYHDKIRYGGNREKCFERDGYKCVRCGSVKQLVPHHKDGSGQTDTPNHDLGNLETLCRKCHLELHDPNPNKPNRVTRVCEYCGNEFDVVPSKVHEGRGKYCSMACRRASGK